MMAKAGFVADPEFVNQLVLAGHEALYFSQACPQHGVGPHRAEIADARDIGQFPGPRAKAKITRGQSPHGTYIGGVARVFAIEGGIGVSDDLGIPPPLLDGQNRITGQLILKAYTAGTDNAALCVEDD